MSLSWFSVRFENGQYKAPVYAFHFYAELYSHTHLLNGQSANIYPVDTRKMEWA